MPIRRDLRKFYGREWRLVTRLRIRERAEDRCEHCGRSNGTYYGNTQGKRVLVQCGAAHLNGVAGDDRPANLAWLCRACHLVHDALQHKHSRASRKDAARPLLIEEARV